MRTIVTTIMMLVSVPLNAQILTGGGTVDNPDSGSSGHAPLGLKISNYVFHLNMRMNVCEGTMIRAYWNDLSELYVYLSLRKIYSKSNHCGSNEYYFNCMNTPILRDLFREIEADKDLLPYIQKVYKLDKKNAQQLIQFFHDLGTPPVRK